MSLLAPLFARYPGAQTYCPGVSGIHCDQLVALVLSEKKTASCGRASSFPPGNARRPCEGRHSILCRWDGAPAAVLLTTQVFECKFCDVSEAFARAETGGDLSTWRRQHIAYFERNGGWSEDMLLLCERFRIVEAIT